MGDIYQFQEQQRHIQEQSHPCWRRRELRRSRSHLKERRVTRAMNRSAVSQERSCPCGTKPTISEAIDLTPCRSLRTLALALSAARPHFAFPIFHFRRHDLSTSVSTQRIIAKGSIPFIVFMLHDLWSRLHSLAPSICYIKICLRHNMDILGRVSDRSIFEQSVQRFRSSIAYPAADAA